MSILKLDMLQVHYSQSFSIGYIQDSAVVRCWWCCWIDTWPEYIYDCSILRKMVWIASQ